MYKEIENTLIEHPDVAEVCVIAMRDLDRTGKAGACVVLKRNARSSEQALAAYCQDRLAHVGRVEVRVMAALPKGRTGMVSRKDLLSLFPSNS